ncbi:MAG: spore cortex-lytic enzyme [Clostridia bacterium]
MKRLKICLATLVFLTCVLVTGANVYAKSQITEPVATTIESVEAAVADTREVQTVLKKWGYYTGSVDGINGPLTKAAVKKFQRKYGLSADGVVGPLTASKMGLKVKGGSGSSASSYNNNDLYLLAKLVHSEARGETYTGQVAVAAVVLNRVDDSRFPNTIAGVIYQPWAFTAINDGQFNLEPNQTAYQAARDAMNGWDPTYGAVYYYNPKTATSAWIRSTKTVTVIGQHVFSV